MRAAAVHSCGRGVRLGQNLMTEYRVGDGLSGSEPEMNAASSLQENFIRLQQAEQLRQRARFDEAQSICESLLQRHPDYAGALHTLGLIAGDREDHQQALNYLVRAAMLNPHNWMTLTALSGVYLRLGAVDMAKQTIGQARLIEPKQAGVLLLQGDIFREDREYETARDTYRQALAIDPSLVTAAIGLGWCLADLGEYRQAAEIFESLIERGIHLVEPLRALASFPAAAVRIDLLPQLGRVHRQQDESTAQFERAIAFIRATGFDRAGRHAQAWEQAVQANRSVFVSMQAALDRLDERRRASLAALQQYRRGSDFSRGDDGGPPVSLFIIGPSRSGKTTMEQLVGRLPGVKRGYENPIVENAVRRTFQVSALPPDTAVGSLLAPAYPLFRTLYREELAHRLAGEKVFTNTNSGCVFEAVRIASVFENVQFIFMKRNIEDNLFQIFMREYQGGNPYGYDLKAAREHILWHHQMADLMAEKFPNIVRVIHYEDMIADPMTCLRMAAELCGLSIPNGLLPAVAGDPDCSAPYRHLMMMELER
jgi:tetratricopeptide (TPR) repeat protein